MTDSQPSVPVQTTMVRPIETIVVRVVAALLVVAIVFVFRWQNQVSIQLALIQKDHDAIAANTVVDTQQSSSIAKHWRIVGLHRDWINKLRAEHDLELLSWPELPP